MNTRDRLLAYSQAMRIWTFRLLRRSDVAKWRNYEFPQEWSMRAEAIAEFVPKGASVFEFGAGASGIQRYLHHSCRLVSSDLVQRNPGMLVIDLNRRPLPPIEGNPPRVAVFAGVLEYLYDVPSVLRWIAQYFDVCIASYECAEARLGVLGRIRELVRRSNQGWTTHYTQVELIAQFSDVGFLPVNQAVWGKDDPGAIFVFQRPHQMNNQ